jgi:FtsH-binding integral membrane protein
MINFGKYGKTITAVVTGLIGWITVVVESASESITSGEWIMLVTILATALGVYGVTNSVSPGQGKTP